MDETRGKQGVLQAWVSILFLFVVFIFLLFKFGKSNEVVYNQQINSLDKISREQVVQNLKSEQNSELWKGYIDKIFNEKISSEELFNNYKSELENRTILPVEVVNFTGIIVGDSAKEHKKYLSEFGQLYTNYKAKGVFSESKMFYQQIDDEKTILALSDYDKETILRIATEYEFWAKDILKLDTPAQYQQKSLAAVQDIYQVAYILRKIVNEEDTQIYVMWIAKYAEKVFDILASNYAK